MTGFSSRFVRVGGEFIVNPQIIESNIATAYQRERTNCVNAPTGRLRTRLVIKHPEVGLDWLYDKRIHSPGLGVQDGAETIERQGYVRSVSIRYQTLGSINEPLAA